MKKLRLSVLVFLAAAQLGAAFGFAHHGGVGTARLCLHPSRIESPKTGADGRVTALTGTPERGGPLAASTGDETPETDFVTWPETDVVTWIGTIPKLRGDRQNISSAIETNIGPMIDDLLTYETADELKADLKSAGVLGADANRIVDALKRFDPTWAPSTQPVASDELTAKYQGLFDHLRGRVAEDPNCFA
eukprot:CAMPEP_0118894616 /NCGR_PEP_ID=MMETSP1166-20130328/3317_1 /TAXON_ID=1104430 /ORGANISM="Chrysoreinhardia sp, Strain CCMP3193" /LENGTH=190 /DNA_ID=CAMNT_0006833549 /DNA_START=73 /DNA_END=642 /DNA_ORIENTATION=+